MTPQTTDDLARIMVEVVAGYRWGDPRSRIDRTEQNRAAYLECERDIAAMIAAGLVPEIPRD